jgi:hypothetical protein
MLTTKYVTFILTLFISVPTFAEVKLTFEEFVGNDALPLSQYYSGIKFEGVTTGQDWVSADTTTGYYNASSWPSGTIMGLDGEFWIFDNVSAWTQSSLSPYDAGNIYFENKDATFVEFGYSSFSTLYLEAYDVLGNLIDQDIGQPNLRFLDGNTSGPGILRVNAPNGSFISYVTIHDQGGRWTIDNVTTDASGIGIIPPWSFVQISDTHIASGWSKTQLTLVLNKVIKEVKPAFIVNTGDVANWGCLKQIGMDDCRTNFYTAYSQAIELATDAGIDVYNIPGNHDQRDSVGACDNFPYCFQDPLGNSRNQFYLGRSTFSYDDVILFAVLNTGNGNCEGALTANDIDFLKGLEPCIPKIILTHHPAVASPFEGSPISDIFCDLLGGVGIGILDGREDLIEYCEDPANNVYMVLSGHTHNNHVYDENRGTPTDFPWYIQTASAADGWYRVISFASPPTVQLVQLTEEDYTYESAKLHSPGNLHAYDSDGRHTGYDPDSGSERGIPQSVYFSHYAYETEEGPIDSPEEVMILDPTDDYLWEVVGTEEGTYGLDITSVIGGVETAFQAVDIATSSGAKHVYAVDWDALSAGEEGVSLNIDADGDGIFERTVIADKELTSEEFALQTGTTIDFEPDVLNLRSSGKLVTVYVELKEGFNVSDIDTSTLKLNDTIPALSSPITVGDYDEDRILDLMVKFDRQQVIEALGSGTQMLTLTGRLSDGRPIAGIDFIRMMDGIGTDAVQTESESVVMKDFPSDMEENLQSISDDLAGTDGEDTFDTKEALGFMLYETNEIIGELGPESFNNDESAFELACAIDDVFTMLDEGMYIESLILLENDILQRMDGCANTGQPDEDDWIISIEGQALLYPRVEETIELLESMI